MVRVISDRDDVAHHLERLVELLRNDGGFVHSDLVLRCEKNGLSIEAPRSVPKNRQILKVPNEQLLPIAEFNLYLEGDDICIGTPTKNVSSSQLALMEEMVAVYNLCEKVQAQRLYSPSRLFLEAPDVYRALALPGQVKSREKIPEGDFALEDFLNTRKFSAKNLRHESGGTSVLMPLIDFLNHHQEAGGFRVADVGLSVNRHSPIDGTDECFVRYSNLDAQMAYFTYGFVDESATSVISVPCTIELSEGGSIEINRNPAAKAKQAPPAALKDITPLVPVISRLPNKDAIVLSTLTIPSARFPRSMRRILSLVVGALRPNDSTAAQWQHVLEAEKQIIETNRAYYEDVRSRAESADVADELRPLVEGAARMAEIQLSLLDDYVVRMASADASRESKGTI